jgi:hypothetical protein
MNTARIVGLLLGLLSTLLAAPRAEAKLIPSPDGQTIYDTALQANWLANANLAGTPGGQFGVQNINPNGSMDYSTAGRWVSALNAVDYLGHNNWTLPSSPKTDQSCSVMMGPNGNSFGFGCMNSAMRSLFYRSLGLHYPDTTVPIPLNWIGPFSGPFINFQPYLYWSETSSWNNGSHSFSFNTGFEGSNVDKNYLYVLPMFQGPPPGTVVFSCSPQSPCPPSSLRLQPSPDGTIVYDPVANVTWLADADLAKSMVFTAQCTNQDGTLCINPDGSMTHTTAIDFINAMNAYNGGAGWLGHNNWVLPPTYPDPNCSLGQHTFGFGCTGSPMGELYYNQLGLTQGTPVVPTPNTSVGPFNNVQPYLYWSCQSAGSANPTQCQGAPANGFQWSFSLGNGFQGTDVVGNGLYVMVYSPETPSQALTGAIKAALGTAPELNGFLSEAAAISSAPNAKAKAGRLAAFINDVNAQRGKLLSAAQADQLIALAEAI